MILQMLENSADLILGKMVSLEPMFYSVQGPCQ